MHLPQVLSSAILLIACATGAVAAPLEGAALEQRTTCTSKNIAVRREWRALSKAERLAYIAAIKCMMSKPAQNGGIYAGAKSRYDDFQALHIVATPFVHFNAPFFAWHRWLLKLWETDLKTTCGYTGTQPYWDFSLDNTVASYPKSPLFDTVYGFGGNGEYIADVSDLTQWPNQIPVPIPGRTGGGCVTTGPFANLTVPMGTGGSTAYTPHCLRRDWSPQLVSQTMSAKNISDALNSANFFDFNINMQGKSMTVPGMNIHAGLHIGMGGQIGENSDMYSSPGDPTFWFIHGAIDQMWDKWQRACWSERKLDYSGPVEMFGYPFNFIGDFPYTNVTLDYKLNYPNFGANVTIRDVMDTAADNLCYKYV
ncbi:hypothetical protein B0J14DRAFT_216635 [Halenospora varia]|nr:hypothetical protein B0J14DRAFT_216635 [Halenospora varia]